MHLSRDTVERILRSESPYLRRRSAEVSATLICTVEEGVACRFGRGDWNDAVLGSLLPRMIQELGWKAIEHSARREAVIRCSAPDGDVARAICEIDVGTGWETLPVVDTPGDEG